jgi:hypothetical protein
MAITAPTPMMMPSIVRKARNLFRANALSAILIVINHIDQFWILDSSVLS